MAVPTSVLDKYAERSDNHIGILELMVEALTLQTWKKEVHGSYWTYFVDSDRVNGSMLNKSSASLRAYDSSLVIGRIWWEAVINRSCLHIWIVKSDSNPADEPSRDDVAIMEKLRAISTTPVVPEYVFRQFSEVSPSNAPSLVSVEFVIACD